MIGDPTLDTIRRDKLRIAATACFLWLVGASVPGLAATYYVDRGHPSASDANPGTLAAPWKTIGKAATAMVAGDTAIVVAGTYAESTSTVRSGSSGSRITFRAQGAVVTKTFNVSHHYITIDGFEMTGANDGYMMTWSGNFGELLNNTIHDTGATWGIVRSTGSSLTIRGNLYYSATGPGDDLTVFILDGNNSIAEDNEIGPAKDIDAFRVWGTGHVIRGNYIHDATLSSSGSAAHMDVIQTFAVGCSGCISQVVFEKNIVVNSSRMQLFMTECNGSCATMGPWEIRNNIFVGIGGQANLGIRNIHFYNNTLYNCGAGNNLIMYLYDASGKSDYSGARIKNNVFITPSGISNYGQVMNVGSTGSGLDINYNYVARIGTYASISGFGEPNGINGGNPKFVNAATNDFHLTAGSPAIDRGLSITGFSDDYAGTARPQGAAWDMGAFEYSSGATLPAPTNLRVL